MTPRKRKRTYGEGGIEQRGDDVFRIRYRIGKQRFSKTVQGSKADAKKELWRLLNDGPHIAPNRMTLQAWVDHWISIGAPGRHKRKVGNRTLERYAELLRCHVVPVLGEMPIQQIQPTDIDDLYSGLEKKIAPRTAHHVHTVLGACFGTAVRTGRLSVNPINRAEKIPSPGEGDHGLVLDEDQLLDLVVGFKGTVYFPIVAVAAFTGARRNEILGLQWRDLDPVRRTLRIERAIEKVKKQPPTLKGPKLDRHKRTIKIDDDLVAMLLAERERHLRIVAGVPDVAAVDLSLVKLPDNALMFPNPPATGQGFSFTALRNPDNTTKEMTRHARRLGFPGLRSFHDLRGSHETALLDRGVAVHVVAERCGHDPAVLLRWYAKRTAKSDAKAAEVIGALSKGVLRT